MFSVAILYFVYGVVKFISNAGDDKLREEGKQSIVWAIVGILIMISVYGIIRFALTNFGLSTNVYPLTGN
jgi:phosphotransferase system  glucose/maltose/N-acetylglucosamine-specific IIC component